MAARKGIWSRVRDGEKIKRFKGKNSANDANREIARFKSMGLKAYKERRKIYNSKTKKYDRVAYDIYASPTETQLKKWEKKYRR